MRERVRGRPGSFLPGVVAGFVLAGLGAVLLWAGREEGSDREARRSWVSAMGELREVGILYNWRLRWPSYRLTARYAFESGGREYTGKAVAGGHSSASLAPVASLAVAYAAGAGALTAGDFGFWSAWKTWPLVPPASVTVRYDPGDPTENEVVLARSLPPGSSPGAVARVVPVLLLGLGVGAILLVGLAARPVAGKVRVPSGPPLSSAVFREEDRRRLEESIERLNEEVDRLRKGPLTPEQESFAEAAEELSRTARDGTLVPADHARYGYGRWAGEIFGDDPVCGAALDVSKSLGRMTPIRAVLR